MGFQKTFEPAEFERRIGKVKTRMEKAGFDLLICQDPANMGWLTGFDGWSFYTPQAVVVHVQEASPIWFGRAQDAKSAHITTDLPAENIVAFSEPLVHHQTHHPFDELCELIIARGWGSACIGVDFDAHYYTARAHQHLVNGLPNAKISDNKELVNWARLVKSPAELTYMREAGRIITDTMNNALKKLAPGVRQFEVIADVYRDQVMGLDGKYGDYTGLCPLIQVGEGTSTPHLTWSDEPLPDSGLIVMELGAARRHYHAPLTRTAHIGKPPEAMARLTDVIVEGGDRAIEAAKPGVTCEEVEALWQSVLNRNGFEKKSRVGYSIGLNYPPDWGERTASLRAGDKTLLEAGMCFHFQSGVWLDDFGAAISESIVITEKGGERLSDVARELVVL
ncbi:MAG: M24 family metallopeptidase [Rhodobacteraceae bacterium]|nr:M24 family metallopeptidase [Paracoccaceae bacterium]